MREEKEDVIFFFVVWSALIGSGWVGGGVACGRRSYLGPAEISSFVVLV